MSKLDFTHTQVLESVPSVGLSLVLQGQTIVERQVVTVHEGANAGRVSIGVQARGCAALGTSLDITGTLPQLRQIVAALAASVEEAEARVDARDRAEVFAAEDR